MSSAARLQANRKNARRSTGPVTAEGRAAVCLNARNHGLGAADSETLSNGRRRRSVLGRRT